jgi:hypothetical protein
VSDISTLTASVTLRWWVRPLIYASTWVVTYLPISGERGWRMLQPVIRFTSDHGMRVSGIRGGGV